MVIVPPLLEVVRFPVPVMPPFNVSDLPLLRVDRVRLLLSVTAPLSVMLGPLEAMPRVRVPELPATTLMALPTALASVRSVLELASRLAALELDGVESPRVTAAVPRALPLVEMLTVPTLTVTPPAKVVFAPERVRAEVPLFSRTPVTVEPKTPPIVVVPVVVPLLVIEPTVLIAAALKLTVEAPVAENVILPVLATVAPLKVRLLLPVSLIVVTLLPMGALNNVLPVPVPEITIEPV